MNSPNSSDDSTTSPEGCVDRAPACCFRPTLQTLDRPLSQPGCAEEQQKQGYVMSYGSRRSAPLCVVKPDFSSNAHCLLPPICCRPTRPCDLAAPLQQLSGALRQPHQTPGVYRSRPLWHTHTLSLSFSLFLFCGCAFVSVVHTAVVARYSNGCRLLEQRGVADSPAGEVTS